MVDCVEEVVVGDAVPARGVVNFHPLIVIRKGVFESVSAARYSHFYRVSSPRAQHSRNIERRPAVDLVIFDSTAPVGAAEAVYIAATAVQVPDFELEALAREASGRPRERQPSRATIFTAQG
jgi:hypothetical protein